MKRGGQSRLFSVLNPYISIQTPTAFVPAGKYNL